jgi:pre-rRNA-processing protein TSR1
LTPTTPQETLNLASLPFRFKAGGDGKMPSATHSHRPTTKVVHKAFKSKKATKGALRDQAKGEMISL